MQKIEKIREKPEHIRLRYVWLAVAISMFFILIIWFLSLRSGLGSSSSVKLPEIPAMPQGIIGNPAGNNSAPASAQGEGFDNFYDASKENASDQNTETPEASDLLNALGN
jgi:hypothetical protein